MVRLLSCRFAADRKVNFLAPVAEGSQTSDTSHETRELLPGTAHVAASQSVFERSVSIAIVRLNPTVGTATVILVGGADGTRTCSRGAADVARIELETGHGGDRSTFALRATADNLRVACPTVAHGVGKRERRLAGWTGLEPAASGVTGRRSNQLNYHPKGNDEVPSTFALGASVDNLRLARQP